LNKNDEIKSQTYLGFEIKVCTNSDGIVLKDNNPLDKTYPYAHHGNYSNNLSGLLAAKKAALFYFMAKVPSLSCLLAARVLYRSGIYLEYFSLKKEIEKAGLQMPDEITASDCGNRSIMFDGEKF
jgi:hypothetical protein